jgi:hypothetical protein
MGGAILGLCAVIAYLGKYIAAQWAAKASEDREQIAQLRAVGNYAKEKKSESPK